MQTSNHKKEEYQTASYLKCKLCGKIIKKGMWRQHIDKRHSTYVKKNHPKFHEMFFYLASDRKTKVIPDMKCRLCGKFVRITKWRKHLAEFHKVGDSPRFRDFFVRPDTDLKRAQKQWYDPDREQKEQTDKEFKCGDKLNKYLPKVKIIYNAVCSNRRKY